MLEKYPEELMLMKSLWKIQLQVLFLLLEMPKQIFIV